MGKRCINITNIRGLPMKLRFFYYSSLGTLGLIRENYIIYESYVEFIDESEYEIQNILSRILFEIFDFKVRIFFRIFFR